MTQIEDTELEYHLKGKTHIVAADEVGWGSLAGSVVVVGVRAPKEWSLSGLNDSKKLSAKKREEMRHVLGKLIEDGVIAWHLAERSNFYLDKVGAAATLKECYVEIFHNLYQEKSLIITDGTLTFDNLGVDDYPKVSLIKADGKIPHVMAASILAKTYRDEKMKIFHSLHPQYGWDKNAGYGSPSHLLAIKEYGPCPLHRMSYAPMKNMILPDPRQLKLPGT